MSYGRYNPDVKRIEYKHPPHTDFGFATDEPTPFNKKIQEALDIVVKEECQNDYSLRELKKLVNASLCVRRYKAPRQQPDYGYYERPRAYNDFYPTSSGGSYKLDLGEVKEGLKGRDAINYLRALEKDQTDRWNFSYASSKEVFTEIVQKQFRSHEEKLLTFEPTLKLELDLLKFLESFIEFHVLIDNVLDPDTKESWSSSRGNRYEPTDRIFALRGDAPLVEVYEKHPWIFTRFYDPKLSLRFQERVGYGSESVGGSAVYGENHTPEFIPAEDKKWFHVSAVEREWTEKMYYEKPAHEVAEDRRMDNLRQGWQQSRDDREQSQIMSDAYK